MRGSTGPRPSPGVRSGAWPRVPHLCPSVGVAQLVRAPGCGPGGRGFETPRSPRKTSGDPHGLPAHDRRFGWGRFESGSWDEGPHGPGDWRVVRYRRRAGARARGDAVTRSPSWRGAPTGSTRSSPTAAPPHPPRRAGRPTWPIRRRAADLALEIWDHFGGLDVVVNNAAVPMRRHVTRAHHGRGRADHAHQLLLPRRHLAGPAAQDAGASVGDHRQRLEPRRTPGHHGRSRLLGLQVRAGRLERVHGHRPRRDRRDGQAHPARGHRHRDLGPARQRRPPLRRPERAAGGHRRRPGRRHRQRPLRALPAGHEGRHRGQDGRHRQLHDRHAGHRTAGRAHEGAAVRRTARQGRGPAHPRGRARDDARRHPFRPPRDRRRTRRTARLGRDEADPLGHLRLGRQARARRLQHGRHRQSDGGLLLPSPRARARGRRRGGGTRARGPRPRRRPARRAQPLAHLRSARHRTAVPAVPGRRPEPLLELHQGRPRSRRPRGRHHRRARCLGRAACRARLHADPRARRHLERGRRPGRPVLGVLPRHRAASASALGARPGLRRGRPRPDECGHPHLPVPRGRGRRGGALRGPARDGPRSSGRHGSSRTSRASPSSKSWPHGPAQSCTPPSTVCR